MSDLERAILDYAALKATRDNLETDEMRELRADMSAYTRTDDPAYIVKRERMNRIQPPAAAAADVTMMEIKAAWPNNQESFE